MPIYEYRCANGHQYERWESFEAAAEHACQICDEVARRLITLPSVIFKGSGFYSTDNRKGGSEPSSKPSDSTGANGSSSETVAKAAASAPSETKAEAASSPSSDSPANKAAD